MSTSKESVINLIEYISDELKNNKPAPRLGGINWKNPDTRVAFRAIDYLSEHKIEKHKDHVVAACLYLIDSHLSELTYLIKENRIWAKKITDDIQKYMAEKLFKTKQPLWLSSTIISIVAGAGLEVGDELKRAHQAKGQNVSPNQFMQMAGMEKAIAKMFDDADSAFQGVDVVMPLMQGEEDSVAGMIVIPFLNIKSEIANQVAFLLLLYPSAVARKNVAHLLLQVANKNNTDAVSLRRMITLRNWLPKNERSGIDAVIQKVRDENVECASFDKVDANRVDCYASTIDGVGCMSIVLRRKLPDKTQHLCGYLIKFGHGIKDFWHGLNMPQEEAESLLDDVLDNRTIPIQKTTFDFVRLITAHGLALSIEHDHIPDPAFLQVSEIYGFENIAPAKIDLAAELEKAKKLFGDKNCWELALEIEELSGLFNRECFTKSWFERTQDIDNKLATVVDGKNSEEAITFCLKECLENTREKWALIFFLMGKIYESLKGGEDIYREFTILAKLLHDNMLLEEIPLMHYIAAQTVDAHIYWARKARPAS